MVVQEVVLEQTQVTNEKAQANGYSHPLMRAVQARAVTVKEIVANEKVKEPVYVAASKA